MKILSFLSCIFFLFNTVFGQSISGQWKGSFIDKSSSYGNFAGDQCDYVLELELQGNKVMGSSYTYFTEGGIRYYTICKIEGTYNSKSKSLEVREVARQKTNIPSSIRNCFQTHRLTYFKKDDAETLEGDWLPAPKQDGTCGFGSTTLSRRKLITAYPGIAKNNRKPAETNVPKPKTTPNNIAKVDPTKKNAEIAANPEKPVIKSTTNDANITSGIKSTPTDKLETDPKLEKRKSNILKTIEVENAVIKVDVYDNGEIDGDSVTLYFNGKLLLANKKLTDKAITFKLNLEDNDQPNELVMFAENLGTIAPNTALMVVTDGPNRYEIRITSDLEKSGMIRFIHKSPKK